MKVIGCDNYGRDYNGGKDELVVAENLSLEKAREIQAECQAAQPEGGPIFYKVMPDDYVPYVFGGY